MIVTTKFKTNKSTHPTKVLRYTNAQAFLDAWKGVMHVSARKKDQVGFLSMCEFQMAQPRKKERVVGVTGFVLDVVSPLSGDDVDALQQRAGFAHVLYTIYESEEDAHLVRMLVPLAQSMTAKDFESGQIVQKLACRLGVEVVEQNYDLTTTYEEPVCPPGADHYHFIVVDDEAPVLDLANLLGTVAVVEEAEAPQRPTQKITKVDAEENLPQLKIVKLIDLFIRQHCGGVPPIYAERTFFFYSGRIWCPKTTEALATQLFVDVFREREKTQTVNAMVAAMKLRYYKDTFPTSSLSRSAFRIALENALVDPMTSQIVPDDPGYYLRSQLPFPFDPKAKCALWLKFLGDIFRDDKDKAEKINLLQELAGYLTVPTTHHQVMFWLLGEGANGKSVIFKVLTGMLGEENVSNFGITKLGESFNLAGLIGKLANISDEMGSRAVLKDEVLKQTISGARQMAERKGENAFSFEPYARLVAASNHLPETTDTSHGFFRRVVMLTLNRCFADAEQDKKLADKLMVELPGIFNWALLGLQRLEAQTSFTTPQSSIDALTNYKGLANPVAMFIEDVAILKPEDEKGGASHRTPTGEVYAAFENFCRANGLRRLPATHFGAEMKRLGLGVVKSNGNRYYPVRMRNFDKSGMRVTLGPRVARQSDLEEEMV